MKTFYPDQIANLELELKHIEVLASAPCSEVYATIGPEEPIAIREIAVEVNRSTAAVGEHITKLLSVGLIIPVGTRKRRARTETLYVRSCVDYHVNSRKLTPEAREAYITRFRCQMRQVDRYHSNAQRTFAVDESLVDYFSYRWQVGYMTRENAIKFKEEIKEFHARFVSLLEDNPEVRKNGEYVRVQHSMTFLPTQRESEKRLKSR